MKHLGGQREDSFDAEHLEAQSGGARLTHQTLVRSPGHSTSLVLLADGVLKLRRDDGIGQHLAQLVQAPELENVQIIDVDLPANIERLRPHTGRSTLLGRRLDVIALLGLLLRCGLKGLLRRWARPGRGPRSCSVASYFSTRRREVTKQLAVRRLNEACCCAPAHRHHAAGQRKSREGIGRERYPHDIVEAKITRGHRSRALPARHRRSENHERA